MAIDLSAVHDVTLTDLSEHVLQKVLEKAPNLKIQQLDVTQVKELQATLQAFDLVVSAVPGFLGYQTLKNIIAAQKNVVDISFCTRYRNGKKCSISRNVRMCIFTQFRMCDLLIFHILPWCTRR